jgi:hypothetical protein
MDSIYAETTMIREIKVQINFSEEQDMKAQRDNRCISLLFL